MRAERTSWPFLIHKTAQIILVDAESNVLNTAIFYAKKQKVESMIRTIHADVFPENLKKKRFNIVIANEKD